MNAQGKKSISAQEPSVRAWQILTTGAAALRGTCSFIMVYTPWDFSFCDDTRHQLLLIVFRTVESIFRRLPVYPVPRCTSKRLSGIDVLPFCPNIMGFGLTHGNSVGFCLLFFSKYVPVKWSQIGSIEQPGSLVDWINQTPKTMSNTDQIFFLEGSG